MSVTAELKYHIPGQDGLCRGLCSDLSHSGIKFETEHRIETGTVLDLTIDTKSKKFEPMNVVVTIIRVEPSGKSFSVAGRITEYKS